jgi:cytochrome c553
MLIGPGHDHCFNGVPAVTAVLRYRGIRTMNKQQLSILALASAFALLAGPAYAGDAAAGKAKAESDCADCHGMNGKDDEEAAIAGMSVADFTKAITEYQNGTRTKDAKMAKAAKKLSAADVANLAAYYATQPK